MVIAHFSFCVVAFVHFSFGQKTYVANFLVLIFIYLPISLLSFKIFFLWIINFCVFIKKICQDLFSSCFGKTCRLRNDFPKQGVLHSLILSTEAWTCLHSHLGKVPQLVRSERIHRWTWVRAFIVVSALRNGRGTFPRCRTGWFECFPCALGIGPGHSSPISRLGMAMAGDCRARV